MVGRHGSALPDRRAPLGSSGSGVADGLFQPYLGNPLRLVDLGSLAGRIDLGRRGADCRERALHRLARTRQGRSEEHTSELQSLMRISYAVFCLKIKIKLIRSTIY